MKNSLFRQLLIILTTIVISSCGDIEPVESPVDNTNSISIINQTNNTNSEITFTTVKISGKILTTSNRDIISRGVCWSAHPNPTIMDDKIDITENNFSTIISNLTQNTKYHFRIFAITESSINYSLDQTFSTLSLANSTWKFTTNYPPSQYSSGYSIQSKIQFYSDGTAKFDEIGSGQGYFITYGTWQANGNNVTYIWEGSNPSASTYVYNGTISGSTISGNFTHPTVPGTWNAIPF